MLDLALEQQPAIEDLLHEYQKSQRGKKNKGKQPASKRNQSGTSKAAQEVVKAVSAQNKRKAEELVSVFFTIKPSICKCVY